MKIKLAPSILSADFARLGQQAAEAEAAGADYLHVDVMDGHFVPNLSIGPAVVAALRPHTRLPLDVHLMIENPDRYLAEFAKAGAGIITVHVEACPHLHRTLAAIRELGAKAGVSLNPATPLSAIEEALPWADLALVMSVNPGFGGQKFIPASLDKIRRLRALLDARGFSATELEVDGGINAENVAAAVAAGARVLVAGAAVFNQRESVAEAIGRLRAAMEGGTTK